MDSFEMQEVDGVWAFLKIIAACIATAVAVVSMVYDKFQTVDSAKSSEQVIERRLERIENKIDQMLLQRKGD